MDNVSFLQRVHNIQETYGYIPEREIEKLAKEMNKPKAKVYGTIRFYSMFYTKPVGKYVIRICDSLSCRLENSENLVKTIKEYLEIEDGETTEDKLFTLEVVECLGHCGEGPVMMVNDEIYTHLNKNKVLEVLKDHS